MLRDDCDESHLMSNVLPALAGRGSAHYIELQQTGRAAKPSPTQCFRSRVSDVQMGHHRFGCRQGGPAKIRASALRTLNPNP